MAQLKGNALLYAITVLTSMGFLLIGYDNGLMGGLVNSAAFDKVFNIDPLSETGSNLIAGVTSVYEAGAFVGALITSVIGEGLGRRKSIFIGVVIMIIGAILQASSYGIIQFFIARVVSGIGMGFVNSTVPVYMAEFAPKASRGIFVCAQLSTLNFGIMMVYWIDYGFTSSGSLASYNWRVPVILQCVFLFAMLILVIILPESPRWLASHGKANESLEVLRRLLGPKMAEDDILLIHGHIQNAVAYEASVGSGSWKDLVKNDEIMSQRRFLIACSVQIFQQLGGINALIYYANTIFRQSLNFDDNLAGIMSGVLNTWFFLASFIPWFLIDRVGRRPLFLSMISLMAAVMIVQTGLIYNVQNKTAIATSCGAAAAAMLFIFQGAFTIGFQATVWVYPSEILPLKLRQRGSSVSTACNWICNFIIVYITPPAIRNIGYKTYIVFGVLNATWVPIIYFFYPETKGLALEDVDTLFAKNDEVRRELSVVHDSTMGKFGTSAEQNEVLGSETSKA